MTNKEMTQTEKKLWVKSYLQRTLVKNDGKKVREMVQKAWGIKQFDPMSKEFWDK